MVSSDKRFLLFTAFISGMTIMALEMSASRLIAPYFGTSIFVWTNIIGVTMIALSIGYYFGGKIADRNPEERLLFSAITLIGFFSLFIPFLAPPVMELSVRGIESGSAGIFYGSLLATTLFFAPPMIGLAGVSPFIIRLSFREKKSSGFTTGRVFAVSTVGSIIGTFMPALLTIPLLGTKKTIIIFGVALIVLGLVGMGKRAHAGLALFFIITVFLVGPAKPADGAIFEKESVHNYIQVVEKNGVRYLKLNEGRAFHSIYNPTSVTVSGVWDYFNILPLLNPDGGNALIIGLAGGTIAREYRAFFPNIDIDGVEIDGEIIEAGKQYFDMEGPNLETYNMDGRVFLTTSEKEYDFIIIDAYKQPYIPFHLTTREFFEEVKGHLNEEGIVAINVAAVDPDTVVLRMIQNTMASVYNRVYVLNPRGTLNYIVFASQKDLSFEINTNDSTLKPLVLEAAKGYRPVEFDRAVHILTDDKAPVEVYTDIMIIEYVMGHDTKKYTQLFE